jgi:hypothetical protein
MSLNAIAIPAPRDPGPLVTRCRSRTVAKSLDRVGGAQVDPRPCSGRRQASRMRAVASASRATRHSGCGPACAFARKCFRLIGGVFSREALAAEIDEQGQSSPLAIRSRTPEKGAELLRSLAGRPWNFQRRCVPASSRRSSFGPQTAVNCRHFEDEPDERTAPESTRCRQLEPKTARHTLLAMQKVVGSNPISRFAEGLHLQALFVDAVGWCFCVAGDPLGTGVRHQCSSFPQAVDLQANRARPNSRPSACREKVEGSTCLAASNRGSLGSAPALGRLAAWRWTRTQRAKAWASARV